MHTRAGRSEAAGRRGFAWVLVASACLLLAGAIGPALIDPDEARFARTSAEMLRSGDLVVPSFEGHPRLAKPPLLHWIQAAAFSVLGGPSELGARLPAILATLGTLLLVRRLGRRLGEEGATWAAAVYATAPLAVALGRQGTTDALLALHAFAAVVVALEEPDAPGPGRGALVGALLGLAFLAKGPVGVFLPLLAILGARTFSGRAVAPSPGTLAGATAAWAAVVLPWGLAFLERLGWGAAGGTLNRELLARVVEGTDHVEPLWYYLPAGLAVVLPWSGPLVLALVRVVRLGRDPSARTARGLAAGLAVGVVALSVSRGKLPSYLLPLAPLAALLVSWELGREIRERERSGSAVLAATQLVLAAGIVVAGRAIPGSHAWPAVIALLLLAGAAGAAWGAVRLSPRIAYGSAAAAAFLVLLACLTGILPALSEDRSARPLVRVVPELQEARPVVVVGRNLPSLTFYLDRVPEILPAHEVPARLARGDRPVLVVERRDLGTLPPHSLREIGRAGRYVALGE